jgi:hypothetical protein
MTTINLNTTIEASAEAAAAVCVTTVEDCGGAEGTMALEGWDD